MKLGSSSDLARVQMLQRQAIGAREARDRAALEMTTSQKASRFEATGGNLTRLFSLERALDRNAVFTDTIALSEMRLDIMQESFGRLLKPTEELMIGLNAAVGTSELSAGRLHAATARQAFADAVGILNTRVSGQALFAGAATDRAAVAPAAQVLADLDALAAGSATAADAVAAIEAYFTPGGGFFTNAYTGGADPLTPVEIGEGSRLDYQARATDPEIVSTLRAHALAAVVAGGAFSGDDAAQLELLEASGARMLQARDEVLALRARVGVSQNAVERARAERVSERDTLDLARTRMTAVDEAEAASRYQAHKVQLEALYVVMANLSELRFSNYMR